MKKTTAWELYTQSGNNPFDFILESSSFNETYANKSIVGTNPSEIMIVLNDMITIFEQDGKTRHIRGNPIHSLDNILNQYLFSFKNRIAVGYISYDFKDLLNTYDNISLKDNNIPVAILSFYDRYTIINEATGNISENNGTARDYKSSLYANEYLTTNVQCLGTKNEWTTNRADYIKKINLLKSEIKNGNVYEVNLSNKFICHAPLQPFEYYDVLRSRFPAYYGALLNYGKFSIISNSPEEFLSKNGNRIRTRPIKGTIERSPDPLIDRQNKLKLLKSGKDFAELAMIIDLERNDFYKICHAESVKVESEKQIESHPTVHHLSATITGELINDTSFSEILIAAFPGGSVTGAPKTTSINMIEKMEPTKRGIYTGAIGYITSDNNFCFNMAIRTALHIDSTISFNSGGAITIGSEPESEYDEISAKSKAFDEILHITTAK